MLLCSFAHVSCISDCEDIHVILHLLECFPKLIINEAKAYLTDTMYRVAVNSNIEIKSLTASYYNFFSLAFPEIYDRIHRDDVLEFIPNEAEEILLPYHPNNEDLLPEIDRIIRKEKDINEILALTNQKILNDFFGISNFAIDLVDSIWKKLSKHRLNRGKG